MGVLPCRRTNCNSIMCNTYIDGVGRVCFDCQEEFTEYLEKEGIEANTENKIREALKKFMDIPKDEYLKRGEDDKEISPEDFFRKNTK